MTILELLGVLRRRGWIILVLAALCAGSAFVFSRLQIPIYEATARVLVKPSRTDFGLTQSAKTLLRSYTEWMRTRDNAQRVIDELKLNTTSGSLLGNVQIASDDSNFTIQIDARSTDGEEAKTIARMWAQLLEEWRNSENATIRQDDRVTAELLEVTDYSQFRPQTSINVLAGAILGALLGGLILFVLEYLEAGLLRSRLDVERTLGLTVLAAVPVIERK
jgi:capsular polysaccharide biosynthesis protein